MPLSLTTLPHLSISLAMKAPNSFGLMRTMSAPSDSRRFCVSGEDVEQRRAAAAERDVDDVDAGVELEQLAAGMLEAADAGRGIVELARLRLGEREELLHGLHAERRIDRQHVGAARHDADRHE